MPRIDLDLRVDVKRSPRVTQLEGMFDVPRSKRAVASFHFEAPLEDREWQVGLITGPSGAGKSSVARHLFGDQMVDEYPWAPDAAVVDNFGDLGIREITAALNSVGFSSPPSWLKPYRVLSTGEKFRANMARALVDTADTVVVDEFTTGVDRTVAQIGSSAIGKAVRRTPGKRFVAVSCHDDIVDWLQPDWVLEPHAGAFAWRSVQRPPKVEIEVVRVHHSSWKWFADHHYLTANLQRGARCLVGLVDGAPAAFAGVLLLPHPRRRDLASLSRLVVLPDYQGLGLGARSFVEAVARIAKTNGRTLCTHPSHPALVKSWAKSKLWRMTSKPRFGTPQGKTSSLARGYVPEHTMHRRVAHFMWAGGGLCGDQAKSAKSLWSNTSNRQGA